MRRIAAGIALLLVLFFGAVALAHEERTPLLVDTDMALDDVRAISLMVNSPHLAVKAVVTSDGASSPAVGCENVRWILGLLEKSPVPVGAGKGLDAQAPPWRDMSEMLGWSQIAVRTPPGKYAAPGEGCSDAVSVILDAAAREEGGIVYVALGPLTNLAAALRRDPSLGGRIKDLYYYGSLPGDPVPDWNTSRDPEAARAVFSSGLRIHLVRPAAEDLLVFDSSMLAELETIDTPAACLVRRVHGGEGVQGEVASGHLKAWDETVALLLEDPLLGRFEESPERPGLFRFAGWDRNAARSEYLELMAGVGMGGVAERVPVVLLKYPVEPSRFQEDLRPFVPRIIALHGVEEWKATVLTNELHRHLGIYSILGAKMGIRAREILNASLDELTVESHAGLKPPLSCLNDGLQVATGASLGRGTISVPQTAAPVVEAVFVKQGRRLRLTLKDSVKKRIVSDIQGAIQRYGDVTPEYFREVRRLSFQYWVDMNRMDIFDVTVDTP